MRVLLVALLIVGSAAAQAKDSGGGGGDKKLPTVWFGIGAGQMKIVSPKDDIDPDGYLNVEVGGQDALFLKALKFVQFTMAAYAGLSAGKLNYKYLNQETNVTYTASDVKYSMTNVGVRIGLQFRLIDAGWFRFFVEGGGFADSTTINYTLLDTTASNSSVKSEKDIQGGGWYADSGIDIRVIRYGVRLGGRQMNGEYGKLKGVDRQIFKHQSTFGYLAFFKDF